MEFEKQFFFKNVDNGAASGLALCAETQAEKKRDAKNFNF